MKEIILLKAGEIALKGLNRSTFEDRLVKNCKFRLRDIGSFRFTRAQSTMYADPSPRTSIWTMPWRPSSMYSAFPS